LIHHLATVGLWMSGISFVLFVIAVLLQLFRGKGRGGAGGAGAAAEQEGADSLAKLMEAFAKLADSLNHSGPVVLTLMAAIIFFVLALLAAGVGTIKGETTDTGPSPAKATKQTTEVCVLYPFAVGEHQLGPEGLGRLAQKPDRCTQSLLDQAGKGEVSILLLIGHADRQPLSGRLLRYYGTNEELAYKRALEVKDALVARYNSAAAQKISPEEFARRIVVLAAGAHYLDPRAAAEQLAQDRSVEIVSCLTDGGQLRNALSQ